LFFTVIASEGHSRTHLRQPIHARRQFFRAAAPFSVLRHITTVRFFASPTVISPLGQVLTQRPQPVHNSMLICAMPFSRQMA
jgi:hypothetical protein